MRRRLTRQGLFRRTAAPDEFSGRNPNTPINLYDIKPNARFPVGSLVTFVDSRWVKVKGRVLGHAAEDRLWVQLPNEVAQLDVEDVVGFHEIESEMDEQMRGSAVASRGSRRAAPHHVALRGEVYGTLSPAEHDLLEEIDRHPGGLPVSSIKNRQLMNLLFQKGYLEWVPGGKVQTLGVLASRRARNATLLTFDDADRFNDEEDDEDLEFIPSQPDFRG